MSYGTLGKDNMSDLNIREAKLTDRSSINDLFTQELQYHKKLLPDMFTVPDTLIDETWLDSVIKNENEHLAVFKINDSIVGAILYKIRTSPNDIIFKERRYGYIQEMIVAESERRKGIGKKLLEYAEKDLLKQGVSEIELNIWENNESGMRFYENYGFKTIQRRMKIKRE
jgi:ribosomal protein S18 acetylase RimI-like enzyme